MFVKKERLIFIIFHFFYGKKVEQKTTKGLGVSNVTAISHTL